ncbi:hypothetical protein ACOSP7_003896 [Xanthoceras sorbifolium]
MMDNRSQLRRRGNSTWDMEGQTQTLIDDHLDDHHHDHTRTRSFIALPPIYFICQVAWRLSVINSYKKRTLVMFFLVMEAVSVVLDVIGKNKLKFLVAAFFLSALGFSFAFYAHIKRRASRSDTATTEVPAEKHLRMLKLIFSTFAMIAVVFIFENDHEISDPLNNFSEKSPLGGADSIILHGVVLDKRDLSLHGAFLSELRKLLDEERPSVPQVFVKGRYIGGAKELGELNESGRLGRMLGWARTEAGWRPYEGCGCSRFVPCSNCGGSCRVLVDGVEDRCIKCNENGLVRCPSCL